MKEECIYGTGEECYFEKNFKNCLICIISQVVVSLKKIEEYMDMLINVCGG